MPRGYAIRRQDVGIGANHPGARGVAYPIVKPGFRHQVATPGASAPGYGADSGRAPATARPAQKRRESRNRRILSGDRDFAVLASPDLRGRRRPDTPGGKRRYGVGVAALDTAGGGGFSDFDVHGIHSFWRRPEMQKPGGARPGAGFPAGAKISRLRAGNQCRIQSRQSHVRRATRGGIQRNVLVR